MSKTAFLTGASGFVGSHLARQLHEQGWEVHVLARSTSRMSEIEDLPLVVHNGDITDSDSLIKAVPPNADAVFHVAASTNFWSRRNDEQTRINVDGTANMVEAAARAGAKRFLHTSSFVTWGFPDGEFNEGSERSTRWDWINYVRTKTMAEQLVLEAHAAGTIDAVILNPANVLGPGDWHNWSRLFRILHQGKLPALPPGGGNFCAVEEVAAAHIRAVTDGSGGEKYLLGGHFARIADVIRMAGEKLDCRVPNTVVPAWLFRLSAQLAAPMTALMGSKPDITPESAAMASCDIRCDSSRAEQELGYRAVPVETMVRDTINWMEKRGLLK